MFAYDGLPHLVVPSGAVGLVQPVGAVDVTLIVTLFVVRLLQKCLAFAVTVYVPGVVYV